MPETLKHVTGTVIKGADLPDELKASSEDVDLWAYASVEVSDREKDIVRVAGLSLKNHTPAQPIPILASHDRTIGVDGYPVVGKSVRFKETVYKAGDTSHPALAFGMKFAPTPFGRTMKCLYDDGHMSNFSIGFKSVKAEPIKGGGLDFKESELYEISAVVLGMNQNAHVMRALGLDKKPTDIALRLDSKEFSEVAGSLLKHIDARLDDIEKSIMGGLRGYEVHEKDGTKPANLLDCLRAHANTKFDEHTNGILAVLKNLIERIDNLESATVAKAHGSDQPGDSPSDAPEEVDWTALSLAVDSLKSALPPTRK